MSQTAVVFDIGNVLVNWDPHPVWQDELGSREAVKEFMQRVDFKGRNLRCDNGETFAQVAAELSDPDDARLLALYPSRFHLSVEQAVPGTWDVVDRLEARGIQLHAITNWSAETWPMGLKSHPRLGTMFGTTIVSGEVNLIKPDARIYERFLAVSGLQPRDCIFIDDKAENVAAAQAVGMDGVQFTDAARLEAALRDRGLL